MITTAQFNQWELNDARQEVYLFDIEVIGHPTINTLRLSTRQYKRAQYRYHSRVFDFELAQDLEAGIAGKSQIDASDIEVNNIDGWGDEWAAYSFGSVTIRYGDTRWDFNDFRVIMTGVIHKTSLTDNSLRIGIASQKQKTNLTVQASDYSQSLVNKNINQVLTTLLTENGLVSVDSASFSAFSTKYPQLMTVTIDDQGENLAQLIGSVFAPYPGELMFRQDGTAFIAEYTKPLSSSTIRRFLPSSQPSLDVVPPLGEMSLNRQSDDVETMIERASIKSDFPHSYRAQHFASFSDATNQASLINSVLDLYNVPSERVTFPTQRSIANIQLGETIQLVWNRYGYSGGKYGIVTKIKQRSNRNNELEAWFLQ